jgi:hypothetical protein
VASRQLVVGDLYTKGTDNYATAVTVTLPQDTSVTIPVGAFGYVEQIGAGKVTFASDGVSVINSALGYKSIGTQFSTVMWSKDAANTYSITGRLSP